MSKPKYEQLDGKLSSERWTGANERKFKPGENPWKDIYTEALVDEIAKGICIKCDDDKVELRLRLAAAAEVVLKEFKGWGGFSTRKQKREWAKNVEKLSDRLLEKLGSSEKLIFSAVKVKSKKGTHMAPKGYPHR